MSAYYSICIEMLSAAQLRWFMKKRLLFVMNNLGCGGAEKSLVTLLNCIDYSSFEVDLFLFDADGLFLELVPPEVNLLPGPEYWKVMNSSFASSMKTLARQGRPDLMLCRVMQAALCRTFSSPERVEQHLWRYVRRALPALDHQYYAAIGYMEKNPVYFIADKVKASKKIGWVHTNYSRLDINKRIEDRYFCKLDYIVTVSEECARVLKDMFPAHKDKVMIIENILLPELIRKMADIKEMDEIKETEELNGVKGEKEPQEAEGEAEVKEIRTEEAENAKGTEIEVIKETGKEVEDNEAKRVKEGKKGMAAQAALKKPVKLVTVARLAYPKGIDMALEACRLLINGGHEVIWRVIGEGPLRAELEKKIKEYNLEKYFLLEGSMQNPYPCMKNADIYVQPSRYEGKSIAVEEAKVLCRPVVVTCYGTVKDQIKDKVNGLVSDMSPEGLCESIKLLMGSKALRDSLVSNLQKESSGNRSEINKLYRLIEG